MKKFGIRIFCLLMAFQVLFASTGFTVTEHFCKIKGKETYLFLLPKSCCLEKKKLQKLPSQTTFKKQKCCDDKTSYQKIQTPSQLKNHHSDEFDNVFGNDLSTQLFYFQYPANVEIVPIFQKNLNNHPPLFGRSLLIFVQTFLI